METEKATNFGRIIIDRINAAKQIFTACVSLASKADSTYPYAFAIAIN